MRADTVIKALAALAQEHRLAVFRVLVQAGPEGMASGALARAVGLAPTLMSFHLTQLTHAGLVSQRREGRSILYAADYPAMNGVMAYLLDNCCGGEDCAGPAPCPLPEL